MQRQRLKPTLLNVTLSLGIFFWFHVLLGEPPDNTCILLYFTCYLLLLFRVSFVDGFLHLLNELLNTEVKISDMEIQHEKNFPLISVLRYCVSRVLLNVIFII